MMESKGDEGSIVDAVVSYFYEDDEFAQYFEDWCRKRAHLVDPECEEFKLEYTSLHKDYLREFEDKLTEFIDTQGSSVEELYAQLKACPADSEEGVFVQILNATTDFDVFILMMKDAAEQVKGRREEKEEKH